MYWVVVDSAVEQKGITIAFPGIIVGEMDTQIYLCTVHRMRTWRRNIHDKKLIGILIKALHKSTAAGCVATLEEVFHNFKFCISAMPFHKKIMQAFTYALTLPHPPPRPARIGRDGDLKPAKPRVSSATYISETVIPKKAPWGMHSRQHVPALLQMATTNAAESYHRLLKRGRWSMKKFGLEKMFAHVAIVNDKRIGDAEI